MLLKDVVKELNKRYPIWKRPTWYLWCQALTVNTVEIVSPLTQLVLYPTAKAAYRASTIVSKDPLKAPAGAIHYWDWGTEGHVGVSLGGGRVLMTGKKNTVPTQLGRAFGVTTVSAYNKATGLKYLGWANSNGKNVSIVGKIQEKPDPVKYVPKVSANGAHKQVTKLAASGKAKTLKVAENAYTIAIGKDVTATVQVTFKGKPGTKIRAGISRQTITGGKPTGAGAKILARKTMRRVNGKIGASGTRTLTIPATKIVLNNNQRIRAYAKTPGARGATVTNLKWGTK